MGTKGLRLQKKSLSLNNLAQIALFIENNAVKIRFVLAFLLLSALPCVAHTVIEEGDHYAVSHKWNYLKKQWQCSINIPVELYQYYQGRRHVSDDMVQFVLSDHDRGCIRSLVNSFREGGIEAGYSDRENMGNVIKFVQTLRYVSDMDSKGTDDYVRFPIESLVDGEGDCEDMAILAAAILHEMGYSVLLVVLPDHLALAIAYDEELDGTYYPYNGSKYYFLEVTHPGWDIGQIPDTFKKSKASLVPLVYQPMMRLLKCSYQQDSYYLYNKNVRFVLHSELENAGPGQTEGLQLHVLFKSNGRKTVVDRVFTLQEMMEGEMNAYELELTVPRPFHGSLEVHVEGDNFNPKSMSFDHIKLK